jgi:hypothetical protein
MATKNQGLSTKNLVKPPVRTGKPAAGINPNEAAARRGQARDPRAVENLLVRSPTNADQTLGNAMATNVGKGGPGTGRKVMATGAQCCTGTNPGNQVNAPRSGDVMSHAKGKD